MNTFDFSRFEAKAKDMNNLALESSIRDCVAAARACSGHDTRREGAYMDEASVYRLELNRRTGAQVDRSDIDSGNDETAFEDYKGIEQ